MGENNGNEEKPSVIANIIVGILAFAAGWWLVGLLFN